MAESRKGIEGGDQVKIMPKRTNGFQQLIHAIEMQLNDNSLVTESKLLPDWATGDEREADIVIETGTGSYCMRIIECRDHARPQTIEWIDQMYGKHGQMAHKLVLVSKSGFTASAKHKAVALCIETLTFEEAKEVDWTRVAGKLTQVQVALAEIQVMGLSVFPPLDASNLDANLLQFYNHEEELQGTLWKVALDILQNPTAIEEIMKTYSNPGNYITPNEYQFPAGCYIIDAVGLRHEVEKLRTLVTVRVKERIPVDLQHGSYKESQVAYGTLKYDSEQGLLTVVETLGKPLSADLSLKKN